MTKKLTQVKVITQQQLTKDVNKIVFYSPKIAQGANPGQFVHLKPNNLVHPLLRRPISIADVDKEDSLVTIIYRIIGEGTKLLSRYNAGEMIDCMGPLGKGFSPAGKRPLVIGGGMGIAPLIYLVRSLCPRSVHVLLGGRNKDEMFWQSYFNDVCDKVHLVTDDGTLGKRGTTLDVLPQLHAQFNYDMIYTCGPEPMMKKIVEFAQKNNIPCQISLEKYMACGVGACLSCSCGGKNGKRVKVCTDGPVFWSEEVEEW